MKFVSVNTSYYSKRLGETLDLDWANLPTYCSAWIDVKIMDLHCFKSGLFARSKSPFEYLCTNKTALWLQVFENCFSGPNNRLVWQKQDKNIKFLKIHSQQGQWLSEKNQSQSTTLGGILFKFCKYVYLLSVFCLRGFSLLERYSVIVRKIEKL